MASERQLRIQDQLRVFASEFINEDSNRQTLITVTHVTVSPDLRQATVYISVFPEDQEHAALDYLKRKRPLLRAFIMKKVHLKQIPFFEIELDLGEKHRQRIDEALKN